ncbi:hypothetical protein [Pseudodesulfovibrio methanolicus]|uniref:Aldo/keto reductase n=1 Tax=Pseudodesulfovibrio methanolicus TaxID=3126690 RepID=A0ABZ2IWE1_9BACT
MHDMRVPETMLNGGRAMPALGLGTYQLNGSVGVDALPKSASPERQAENMKVFNFGLCDADMAAIDALARPDGRLKGQDPAVYEEF